MFTRRDFFALCLVSSFSSQLSAKRLTPWHLGTHGDFSFTPMVENVYIMHGAKENDNDAKCFVHNPAFIESKNGIIIIDSGASYIVGKAVLGQIRQISDKPVIAIFNTHHHSDHWFANSAIQEAYPKVKIYGHKNIIASSKEQYFGEKNKRDNLCKAKKMILPNHFVEDGDSITIDGEQFDIQHPNKAHTNSDISITHKNSNVLFLGDTVLQDTLGYFGVNSSILGNIEFLEKILKQKKYALYVPGHGQSGNIEKTVKPYLFYLKTMRYEVEKAYQEGKEFYQLEETEAKIKSIFTWDDDFNFPLTFLQPHMQTIYSELECISDEF